MTLDQKIEAILFFKAESVSVGKLAQMLEVSEDEIKQGLAVLEEKLSDRGIKILYKEDKVMLGTAPEMGELIESLIKEELSKDLGKAGLETLSIVLYRGPISRSKIDYIRGVSSTFILRNLLVRGLVERVPNPDDQRSFLYKPTFELLSYLGITKVDELPEYGAMKAEIESFEKVREAEAQDGADQIEEDEISNEMSGETTPGEM
jgi:segregation and condensation protein B